MIIVPNTNVGESVKVRVNKVARKLAFGEVLEKIPDIVEEGEELPQSEEESQGQEGGEEEVFELNE